jgi:hypothetical protein
MRADILGKSLCKFGLGRKIERHVAAEKIAYIYGKGKGGNGKQDA